MTNDSHRSVSPSIDDIAKRADAVVEFVESFEKGWSQQPRVPSGPKGGQWTSGGGFGGGFFSPNKDVIPDPVFVNSGDDLGIPDFLRRDDHAPTGGAVNAPQFGLFSQTLKEQQEVAAHIPATESPKTGGGSATQAVHWSNESPPSGELNKVAFDSWRGHKGDDWADVEGQKKIAEPDFPKVPELKRAGSGVVIVEPDGRVWLTEPTDHFGGYAHTFPKGGMEPNLSLQANAIKEAFEETGLKVEITGFLADIERDTSVARYYVGKRVGGTPADHGWETQAVKLVPVSKLKSFLNKDVDRSLADMIGKLPVKKSFVGFVIDAVTSVLKNYNPAQPRVLSGPKGGQWTSTGGGGVGVSSAFEPVLLTGANPDNSALIAANKAIQKYADAANKGDLAWLYANKPHVSASPNPYQKGRLKNWENAVAHVEAKQKISAVTPSVGLKFDATWDQIGSAKGTNPGGLYKAPDGKTYYVKFLNSDAHVGNELAAARLADAAGQKTLKYHRLETADGKPAIATEWVQKQKSIDLNDPADIAGAKKSFIANAWLGNYDAIGTGYGDQLNQAVVGGSWMTMDYGGSMLFRAQGAAKGESFGNTVAEFDSMRNPSISANGAKVYGKLTNAEIVAQIDALKAVDDNVILGIIMSDGPGTLQERAALADKMVARRNDLIARGEAMKAAMEPPKAITDQIDPPGPVASAAITAAGIGAKPVFPFAATAQYYQALANKVDAAFANGDATAIANIKWNAAKATVNAKAFAAYQAKALAALDQTKAKQKIAEVEMIAAAARPKNSGKAVTDKVFPDKAPEPPNLNIGTKSGPKPEAPVFTEQMSASALYQIKAIENAAVSGSADYAKTALAGFIQQGATPEVKAYAANMLAWVGGDGTNPKAGQQVLDTVKALASPGLATESKLSLANTIIADKSGLFPDTAKAYAENMKAKLEVDDLYQALKEEKKPFKYLQDHEFADAGIVTTNQKNHAKYLTEIANNDALGIETKKGIVEGFMTGTAITPEVKAYANGVFADLASKSDKVESPRGVKPDTTNLGAALAAKGHQPPAKPIADIPPPPTVTSTTNIGQQKKFNLIHAYAQSGNIEAILALNYGTNTYGKQQAKYANVTLAALGSDAKVVVGAKAASTSPAKAASVAATMAAVNKLNMVESKPAKAVAFDPAKLPSPPDFNNWMNSGIPLSKNPEFNAANNAKVAEMFAAAKSGDIEKLKAIQPTVSGKTSEYKQLLIDEIMEQKSPTGLPEDLFKTHPEIPDGPNASAAIAIAATYFEPVKLAKIPTLSPEYKVADYVIAGKMEAGAAVSHFKATYKETHYVASFAAEHDGMIKSASLSEREALKDYTNSAYKSMNKDMRAGKLNSSAKTLLGFFDKAPPLPEGISLRRNLTVGSSAAAKLMKIPVGTIIQAPQFESTSTGNVFSGNLRLRILTSKGTRGFSVENFSSHSEREVILRPNTRYLKVGSRVEGGRTILDVIALPSEKGEV